MPNQASGGFSAVSSTVSTSPAAATTIGHRVTANESTVDNQRDLVAIVPGVEYRV
jgi:hypothetical protein